MRKLAFLFVPSLLACGSSGPSDAVRPAALDTLVGVSGSGQSWFTNSALPAEIVVQAGLSDGKPVGGLRVVFRKQDGVEKTVFTSPDGFATFQWMLGPSEGAQYLQVNVNDQEKFSHRLTAQAISGDSADVAIVHGVTDEAFRLVELELNGTRVQLLRRPDTVVRFVPRSGGIAGAELVAFTNGHPPISVPAPWTNSADTLHLKFGPPIEIPVSVWFLADSSQSHRRADQDTAVVRSALGETMMGIKIGQVSVHDISNLQSAFPQVRCDAALPASERPELNIYYLHTTTIAGFPGATGLHCGNGRIFVAGGLGTRSPTVLPHEIGHALGLPHIDRPQNLMNPQGSSGQLTLWQLMFAHFYSLSALNTIYHRNAPGVRSCNTTLTCRSTEVDFQ